ncbi:hypothetical protein ACFPRL_03345 [Pseudoclavibacter helvolus]
MAAYEYRRHPSRSRRRRGGDCARKSAELTQHAGWPARATAPPAAPDAVRAGRCVRRWSFLRQACSVAAYQSRSAWVSRTPSFARTPVRLLSSSPL